MNALFPSLRMPSPVVQHVQGRVWVGAVKSKCLKLSDSYVAFAFFALSLESFIRLLERRFDLKHFADVGNSTPIFAFPSGGVRRLMLQSITIWKIKRLIADIVAWRLPVGPQKMHKTGAKTGKAAKMSWTLYRTCSDPD